MARHSARNAVRFAPTRHLSLDKISWLKMRFRTPWLKLAGGMLVGLYGAFSVVAAVLGVLGAVYRVDGAEWMWWIACGCLLVAGFGLYVFTTSES